jgi:hypothetical protein
MRRRALAGFAALVLLAGVASVAIYLIWGTDASKERRAARRARLEETKRSEAEAAGRAEEAVERERLVREEQTRRAEEQRLIAEQELEDEQRRVVEETRRDEERKRRLADERTRAETERRAGIERQQETARRLAAELEVKREAEETARREETARKVAAEAEEEARRSAREEAEQKARQEENEGRDDTADVETDSTIDDAEHRRGWSITGDLRPIVTSEEQSRRDGSTFSDDALGARVRLAVVWGITEKLRVGTRLAGRCFTDSCTPDFVMDSATPTDNGLTREQFTLDQVFVHWFRRARFDVVWGRIQTRYVLRGGVFAKSLDRNDSNNVNVTWTDGVQSTYRTQRGWDAHLVLQRNTDDGTGSIRRGPLDFDDNGARITYFANLENLQEWGPVVQRSFDVSYLPSSLLKDGDPDGRREDYWGVVGRLAARWPLRTPGRRLRVGTEVGYAPETPTGVASQLDDPGDVDGLAWNVVASLIDFKPSHSIGLNYGRADAGWLLSPQFRENDELIEIRYQWRPSRLPLVEARVRVREELERQTGAASKRDEIDFYARLTWQFKIKDF